MTGGLAHAHALVVRAIDALLDGDTELALACLEEADRLLRRTA